MTLLSGTRHIPHVFAHVSNAYMCEDMRLLLLLLPIVPLLIKLHIRVLSTLTTFGL
jgi:hypothetical protein